MLRNLFIVLICSIALNTYSQNRLDSIHIAHYDINLSIVNLTQHQITGFTELSVVPQINGIQQFRIDLQQLVVDSVLLNGSSTTFIHQSPVLKINTPPLVLNDTLSVKVFYHGTPPQDPYWGGFFFTTTYAYNMGVGMQSVPPSFGRCWYPCIDDFNDKATYTFNIETDSDKKAICGGILTDSLTLTNGNKLWKWTLTDPIPTYLSSVAVGPYVSYLDTVHLNNGAISIEIYGAATSINLVPGSFANLKKVVRGFEQKFGTYQWQRIGYVLVPFNAGAMEHATNIGYPASSVNGNTSQQSLLIHELSHSWFGNLLTCSEPQTMWINEGFARYSEIIADEILDTTGITATQNFISLHRSVLKNAHADDGGYYALDGVPQSVTYGTTTYDKGGIVAHSLRSYLGDSLFFFGIKTLFEQNLFLNVNSPQFFDKLSVITGVDLNDFYLGWVHQPGFLHFSVDSVIPMAQQDKYAISMKQKLYHANYFANQNRVDVAFYSNSGDYFLAENITFSGESGYPQVLIPFQPDFWIVDPNYKLSDAIIDYRIKLPTTGSITCNDAFFRAKSISNADTTLLNVEYNLVAPDPLRISNPNVYRISDHHYWKLEYPTGIPMNGEFHFKYSNSGTTAPDFNLLQGYTKDDLILLYRRNATQNWTIFASTVQGNQYTGYVITAITLPGEYMLAVGINNHIGIKDNAPYKPIEVYPNPTSGTLFSYPISPEWETSKMEIFDQNGRFMESKQCIVPVTTFDVSAFESGVYLLVFTNSKNQKYKTKITILN